MFFGDGIYPNSRTSINRVEGRSSGSTGDSKIHDPTEEENEISSTPNDKTATGSTRAEVLIEETIDGINEALPPLE